MDRSLWSAEGGLSLHERRQQLGLDGYAVLDDLSMPDASPWLRELPAVETLRRVWVQQYYRTEAGMRWRAGDDGLPPAAKFIHSPYDAEARDAKKRTTSWVGYKVNLTETCEAGLPHLITNVETTAAPVADGDVVPKLHAALAQKGLLPSTHLVDTGYIDGPLLETSRLEYGVDLLGPARADHHWQANEEKGFAASNFLIDRLNQEAICPQHRHSVSWTPVRDRNERELIKIKFASADCGACTSRSNCTRSKRPRHTLTIRPQHQYVALQTARRREASEEFIKQYRVRAGIEGTISQGVRAFGLRRGRYLGRAKTYLQHVIMAAAINLVRLAAWFAGEIPALTRTSLLVTVLQPCST